jgi:hypothetical protein
MKRRRSLLTKAQKAAIHELMFAGTLMSNTLFNISQDSASKFQQTADRLHKQWDTNLRQADKALEKVLKGTSR